MNKIFYLIFLISFLFISPSVFAQEDCDVFELIPPLEQGQLSTDNPPVPCGFLAPGTGGGTWVNECSPCGSKISDDNCSDAPNPTICELDGFQTTTTGFMNDLFTPTLGFCGPGTGTHNNFWIGFTAQSNVIELLITTSDCASQGNARGIQVAICQTDCVSSYQTMSAGGQPACFGAVGQGGLFNSSTTLTANNLIPGNPYYILVDGFAGGVCELQIDVLDGFEEPAYDVIPVPPGQLCPDILNPGGYTAQDGSGAQVFVTTGGVATTDLTFFWLDPNDNLIATTGPSSVNGNQVIGSLPGSFFTEVGTYTVEIIDNGSCCPLCTSVPLEIASPPAAAAAIISGINGQDNLDCTNNLVVVEGNPDDGTVPAVEQWQIVDDMGNRAQIAVSFVAANGRINELDVTQDLIETYFPNEPSGTITVVYGFLSDLIQLCFGDASVDIEYDFRKPEIDIDDPAMIDCASNPSVTLDASDTDTYGHNATYAWTYQDGTTTGIESGADTDMAVVRLDGFYTVVVTDLENGCVDSLQVEVEGMVDAPLLDPIADVTVNCTNTSVDVMTTADAGGATVNYSWTGPSGALPGNNPMLTVSDPGTYVLTAENNTNGCESVTSFVVTEDLPIMTIDALGDSIRTCATTSITFPTAVVNDGNGDYSYTWTDSNGDPVSLSADLTASAEGIYTLTVIDNQSGCTVTQTASITADENLPVIAALPTDLVLNCNDMMVSTTAVATDVNGDPIPGLTYEWFDDMDVSLGTNPNIDFTLEGDYTVLVSNPANGCASEAPISITLDVADPDVAIATPDIISCTAGTITLSGSSMNGDVSYQWYSGTDETGTALDATATQDVSSSGDYALLITDNTNGCTSLETVNVASNEIEPVPSISTPDVLDCTNETLGIMLDASGTTGDGALTYAWTGPNAMPAGDDAMINATEVGTYTLLVTDTDNGCDMTTSVIVTGDFAEPEGLVATGGTITCTDDMGIPLMGSSTSPNVSYMWLDQGMVEYPGQNPMVTSAGTYTLIVTNLDNGCTASTTADVMNDSNVPTVLWEQLGGETAPISCKNPSREFRGYLLNPDPNVVLTWLDPMGNPVPGNPIVLDENSLEGTYTIEGDNPTNGCSGESSVSITFDFTQPDFNLEGGTILCAPNDGVTLNVEDTDPSNPSSYEWTDPMGGIISVSNPTVTIEGTYILTATNDASGCTATGQVLVDSNNDNPIVSVAQPFDLSCRPGEDNYDLNGSGTAANGTDALSYNWTLNNAPFSTDANPNATEAGTYQLTVTNLVSGCVETASVEIGDITLDPIPVANVQMVLNCETPMVLLEGDATDPMATYQWTSEMNTVIDDQSPMVSEPGEWTLVVTSDNGCTGTTSITVMEDFDLPENVMITGNNLLTCADNSTQLLGTTSTMDIQGFEWSLDTDPGYTSVETAPNVSEPGIYTLTVTGGNGCVETTTFEVSQDEGLPVVSADPQDILTCTTVSTMILSTSSAANSDFAWSGPIGFADPGTQDIEVSVAGEYTLTVTDLDNGCETIATATVQLENADPDISAMGTTVTCETIPFTLSASSMVNNATYSWSGPGAFTSTDANPEITQPGEYTVVVTDPSNGCISNETVTAIDGGDFPEDIDISATVTLLTCDDFESELTAFSSTSGVEITIEGASINPTIGTTITVSEPGVYTATFFDPTNGCENSQTVVISQDDTEPMISPDTPEILNCQRTEVPISVTTNEAIRSYEWSGPMGGLSSTDISSPMASLPGTYTVIITAGDNGCTETTTVEVMEDMNIPVSVPMATEINCAEPTADLMGDASTVGPDISYQWTNAAGDIISTDISTTTTVAGEYTLTVFNSSNACEISEVVMVEQDDLEPTADAGADDVFACADDMKTLSGSGTGQGALSYTWLNDAGTVVGNQATIDVDQSGTFTLIVMDDDNGCVGSDEVVITPDANKPDIDVLQPGNLTCDVVSVELDASNTTGQGTLEFSWIFEGNNTPAGTGPIISVTNPGTYTVTVIDQSNGCDDRRSITVGEDVDEPVFTVVGGEIDCIDMATSVTVEGLTISNPVYSWSGPNGFTSTDPELNDIQVAGNYMVTITNADNGCDSNESALVSTSMDIPQSAIAGADEIDCDTEEVQLTATTTGANLTYSWSGPNIISGGNTLNPIVGAAGEYILTVTDPDNGCEGINNIFVTENTNVITGITPEGDDVNCFGPNTGSIAISQNSVTGGTAPYLYSVDGGASFSTQEEFLGLTAGMYDVVVQDANGCEYDLPITINPAAELVLDLGENQVIAFGDSLMLFPQTNFDIDVAEWNDTLLLGTTPWVNPVNTTSYEIVAFDEDGCITTDNITIFVEKTRPVYIPSGFSPNKDGINDFFTVYADLDLITKIKSFSVYDRWGEKMHEIEEMTPAEALLEINGWDGNFRDSEMNPGVYVYHVLVEFVDGEEIFYEGDVTLFR